MTTPVSLCKSPVWFVDGFSAWKISCFLSGIMVLLSFLYLSMPGGLCLASEPIRLAAFEYPPFFATEKKDIQGIGADLGRALFRRLHLETTLTMYPLKRALIYLQKGDVDCTMILVKSADREAYLVYSDPVVSGSGYIWSNADRPDGPIYYERLEDLRPYRIGVTIGYSYGKAMDRFLGTAVTDSAPEEYQSFKKLMGHRVDIVPATEIIVKSLVKRHPEFHGQFVRSDNAFLRSNYYMAVSKKSRLAAMIPRINRTITEMKNKGVIDAIIKKYTE